MSFRISAVKSLVIDGGFFASIFLEGFKCAGGGGGGVANRGILLSQSGDLGVLSLFRLEPAIEIENLTSRSV